MSTELLEIQRCPICNSEHKYKLEVERAIILQWMGMNAMSNISEKQRSVKVTRLFTCPVKNEEFQSRFILYDSSSDRIKNVKVIGVSDEEE